MELELDFSRDAFGHPRAQGPAELAAVCALLEEDASSPSAVHTLLLALEANGGFNGNVARVELLAAGTTVKVSHETHELAGETAYLERDEFGALLARWSRFLEATKVEISGPAPAKSA